MRKDVKGKGKRGNKWRTLRLYILKGKKGNELSDLQQDFRPKKKL